METIFVLLPLALLIAAIAVAFFVWAARTGQFDDLDTPAIRMLFDDDEPRPSPGAAAGDTEVPVRRIPASSREARAGRAKAETRRVLR